MKISAIRPHNFNFVGGSKSQKQLKEEHEKMRAILQEKKDNNQTITQAELAQMMNLSRIGVQYKLRKYPDLANLWLWTTGYVRNDFTQEEIAEQNEIIKQELELAIKNKKRITMGQLARKLYVGEDTIKYRISNYEELNSLWQKVQNNREEANTGEIQTLTNHLLQLIEKKEKTSYKKLEKDTGIKEWKLKYIIERNEEVRALWDKVKSQEGNPYTKEEITEQTNILQSALVDLILAGKRVSNDELAEYVELSPRAVYDRIHGNQELWNLWNKVKSRQKPKNEDLDIKNLKIKARYYLVSVLDKKGTLTKEEFRIALGVSRSTLEKVLEDETVSALWDSLKHPRNHSEPKDIQKQNEIIKAQIESAIKEGNRITFKQIAPIAGIEWQTASKRVHDNPELLSLWNEMLKL